MKRVGSVLFSIFVLLILASCAADDSSLLKGKLENRWYYAQTISYINNEEIKAPYQQSSGCGRDYIEFEVQNIFKTMLYGPQCDNEASVSVWERDGTRLTIIDGDVTKDYTIEVLIGNQLRLKERIGAGEGAYDKVTYFTIN